MECIKTLSFTAKRQRRRAEDAPKRIGLVDGAGVRRGAFIAGTSIGAGVWTATNL